MQLELSVVVALLVAATALAIAAKRAQVPYNVALVIGGMLIAVSGLLPSVPHLSPEVVFLVCLPALLFEGGITADLHGIRANLLPIALLSTLGMLLAIAGTGASLHWMLALGWGPALLLGAILAVTDTVSILYAFRRIPVPARLAGIMQGESLFNDGTALVMYGAISQVVVGTGAVNLPLAAAKVLLSTVGGLAVGLAIGLAAAWVIRRAEDPLAEIMATTAIAYAAYASAEALHVSGVIAVVTTGLAMGDAMRRDLPPQSRVAIHSFWDYAAFGVNTFLFLLVGLTTSPESLVQHITPTVLATSCVFVGRALAIYLPFLLLRLAGSTSAVPFRWQHVFVVGNVKGALSIALALGLPEGAQGRALVVDVTFGVVFTSLVVQGLMLAKTIGWLGLVRRDPGANSVAEEQGRIIAARAARQELEALQAAGLVPRGAFDQLRSDYQVVIAGAERRLRDLNERHLEHAARTLIALRRRLVDAERTAIVAARLRGLIAEQASDSILADIDRRVSALDQLLEDHAHERAGEQDDVIARGVGAPSSTPKTPTTDGDRS